MHLGLQKKVVLVTGGTKGIGRAIVEGFLEEGAIVHFCSRTQADIDAANEKLSKQYPDTKAFGTAVDCSNTSQISQWVKAAAEHSGRIDVVVANVSAISGVDSPDSWELMVRTDLLGLAALVHATVPHLEKSKGNIVTIASVSARIIDFTAPGPYGACKAAVIQYTASLAHTLAPKGIRANTCSPGNTYVADGVFGGIEKEVPELFEKQMKLNPMGRMGRPEEIAHAVLFLASEKASFVSGTNLVVDGALCQGVQF